MLIELILGSQQFVVCRQRDALPDAAVLAVYTDLTSTLPLDDPPCCGYGLLFGGMFDGPLGVWHHHSPAPIRGLDYMTVGWTTHTNSPQLKSTPNRGRSY